MRSGKLVLTALTCLALAPTAHAQTLYTDRNTFNAVAPGLALETYEEGVVASGSFAYINGPLSSAPSNPSFPTGIMPGLTVSATPGASQPNLILLGNGTQTGESQVVGNQFPTDSLNLLFTPNVNAVGFDLYGAAGPGVIVSYSILVSVFGTSGLITSSTVTGSGTDSFFGITTGSTAISSITFSSVALQSKFADNIAFGTTAAVPEPGSIALLTGLSLTGAAFLRRCKTASKAA